MTIAAARCSVAPLGPLRSATFPPEKPRTRFAKFFLRTRVLARGCFWAGWLWFPGVFSG